MSMHLFVEISGFIIYSSFNKISRMLIIALYIPIPFIYYVHIYDSFRLKNLLFQMIKSRIRKDNASISKLFKDFLWITVTPYHELFLFYFFCAPASFLRLSSDLLLSDTASSSITFISSSLKLMVVLTFMSKVIKVSLLY